MKKIFLTAFISLFFSFSLFAQSYYDEYDSGSNTNFFAWIVILLIAVLIFIICREIVCWYWKINEHINLQKKILEKLDKLDILDETLYELKNLRYETNERAKKEEENSK